MCGASVRSSQTNTPCCRRPPGLAQCIPALRAGPLLCGSCRWSLFAAQHLAREREIGLRALGLHVVADHRLAVRGGLGQPDVAWDHGAIELVAEMRLELCRYLVVEIVARVVHGTQQPLDLKRRIQRLANFSNRV